MCFFPQFCVFEEHTWSKEKKIKGKKSSGVMETRLKKYKYILAIYVSFCRGFQFSVSMPLCTPCPFNFTYAHFLQIKCLINQLEKIYIFHSQLQRSINFSSTVKWYRIRLFLAFVVFQFGCISKCTEYIK